jgi:hypothetical protein
MNLGVNSMKRVLRRALLGIAVVLVAVQFVPVTRSNPPVETEVPAPPEVHAVLRRACYDCHSNQTVWPWYAHVAPVSWLVARDVQGGRRELNFSAWNRMSAEKQAERRKKASEEVSEGKMPPWFYVAVHRDAALSSQDRAVMRAWAEAGSVEAAKSER